MKTKIRKIQVT